MTKTPRTVKLVWNGRTKRIIALFIAFVFVVGFTIGMIADRVIAKTVDVPVTELPLNSEIPTETTIPIETILPTATAQIVSMPTDETRVYYDCSLSYDLQDYIRDLCETENIPTSLVIALISRESSFRADVISDSDDYGLMQINVVNHEWLQDRYGIDNFLDPYQNVFCGITILSGHFQKYQDFHKALMAYNLGATGAKRLWDKGIYSTRYSEAVVATMTAIEKEIKEN